MVAQLLSLLRSPITLVWGLLMLATLLSWSLGTDNLVHGARLAGVLVLMVAFVKVRFVGRYFMEIRDAPPALRWILDGYCTVVCAALVAMFLVAR
jgi:hypothetical protein